MAIQANIYTDSKYSHDTCYSRLYNKLDTNFKEVLQLIEVVRYTFGGETRKYQFAHL